MPAATVSVVIVNLNGRALLEDCLAGLEQQDYPAEQVETILVDNGSADDSVAFVRRQYPHVRVIEAGCNLGFAGGNNLGARHAAGEALAFINNDARADPAWLSASVAALQGRPECACAASKMLNQDGSAYDYVGTALNLYGRAFQIDENLPVAPGRHDEARAVLAPCGGAMLVRRDVFWQVGGFDEDYIAYYEDVDLGWRLWLHGYQVWFEPRAVVYHRKQQTGAGFPVEQRFALSELNALRTVIKNYEEQNLWRALPVSLLLGVKRAVEQAGLEPAEYSLGFPSAGDPSRGITEPEPRMTRVATAYLVAIDQVADEMPRLIAKRQRIQQGRKRSDADIFSRFPMARRNPLFPWRRYHAVQDQLVEAMGVPGVLRPERTTCLLMLTQGSIGPEMTATDARIWEMACALAGRFKVTLAAPGGAARRHAGLEVVGYATDDPRCQGLAPFVQRADVLLAPAALFRRIPLLRELNKPAVIDLCDTGELERLTRPATAEEEAQRRLDVSNLAELQLAGIAGDFFVCGSERQRDFWLGVLMVTGRVNALSAAQDPSLRALIDVVPFGVPAEPPRRGQPALKGRRAGIGPEDKVLLWNGSYGRRLDAATLIEAFEGVLRVRQDVRLVLAGAHPDEKVVERCRAVGMLEKTVFLAGPIGYDERGEHLLEADLGIITHSASLEDHLAVDPFLVDCAWAGLPVIATREATPYEELIAGCGLARRVPPGDPAGLSRAILEQLADEGLRERAGPAVERLRAEMAWARAVEPVAGFVERAAFAPDVIEATRRAARIRHASDTILRLEAEIVDLRAIVQAMRSGRFMRLMRAWHVLLGREE